jgi:hypothetical protein
MDSFTIAVLVGAGVVVAVFLALLVLDKGKPPAVTPAPSKSSAKR